MAKERYVRVYGAQREEIDIDLMTQIVIQMGRQLAQETMTDEASSALPEGPHEDEDGNDGAEAAL